MQVEIVVVAGVVGLALGPALVTVAGAKLAERQIAPTGHERLAIGLPAAVVSATLAARFGAGWELLAFGIVGLGLVVLSWIDLRAEWLPREITRLTMAAAAPFLVVAALVHDEPHRLLDAVLGALLATAILLVVHAVGRGGLGDGDVRLAPLLGMALGWLNVALVPVALLFGFAAGAAAGIALLVTRRGGRHTTIPFGPFLALGTLAAIVAGEPFLDAVLHR
ncbi:MAG: A24 family peptidase [Ilumatobacteraceae bacterium]